MRTGSEAQGVILSVVIVNYNVKYYLEQCLLSVHRAMVGMEAEVFVVDNHSRDGSVEYLEPKFPWVTFISSQSNLGFAKGNNLAIRQSRGRYVLLLNPDTFVGEDVLREAVAFMDGHPKAGGVGVRMLKADGGDALESRRGIPTPMTSFYKMVGLSNRYPKSKVLCKYYMGYLPWEQPGRIEIISGAFCLLRREALEQVGLLDEDFFMYGEDIDLSYRLLQGGWENWYLPLKILHYKGESTVKSNFRYVHIFYEAMFIFLRKHYGHLSAFLSIPIRLGIFCKAMTVVWSMGLSRLRHQLGYVDRRHEPSAYYLFDCAPAHRAHILAHLRRTGLDGAFVDDENRAQKSTDVVDKLIYHVYDLSRYSFQEVLERHAALSRHDQSLATYNPATGLLITDRAIIPF